jgi:hypothetical protein
MTRMAVHPVVGAMMVGVIVPDMMVRAKPVSAGMARVHVVPPRTGAMEAAEAAEVPTAASRLNICWKRKRANQDRREDEDRRDPSCPPGCRPAIVDHRESILCTVGWSNLRQGKRAMMINA